MAGLNKPLEYGAVVVPIMKYLESLPNCKCINIKGGVYTERGTPDILGCLNGMMFLFECKRSADEKPEQIQKWRLAEWKAAGAIAERVNSVDEVKIILQKEGII